LLASYPNGLTGEQLLLLLYGDGGSLTTLKATLSKIRQYIPLTSRLYKISVEYQADFLEIDALLEKGEVENAFQLYKGPLLLKSDVPSIIEMREVLDEKMRQAMLNSGNHSLLEQYAAINQDDLEVLERWLQVIPQNHPQRAFLNVMIKRLMV
jgi:hypothetical protein